MNDTDRTLVLELIEMMAEMKTDMALQKIKIQKEMQKMATEMKHLKKRLAETEGVKLKMK